MRGRCGRCGVEGAERAERGRGGVRKAVRTVRGRAGRGESSPLPDVSAGREKGGAARKGTAPRKEFCRKGYRRMRVPRRRSASPSLSERGSGTAARRLYGAGALSFRNRARSIGPLNEAS